MNRASGYPTSTGQILNVTHVHHAEAIVARVKCDAFWPTTLRFVIAARAASERIQTQPLLSADDVPAQDNTVVQADDHLDWEIVAVGVPDGIEALEEVTKKNRGHVDSP